jgi:predicted amidohydrolase
MHPDLVIRDAHLLDPAGRLDQVAGVTVRGTRIAAIGDKAAAAGETTGRGLSARPVPAGTCCPA